MTTDTMLWTAPHETARKHPDLEEIPDISSTDRWMEVKGASMLAGITPSGIISAIKSRRIVGYGVWNESRGHYNWFASQASVVAVYQKPTRSIPMPNPIDLEAREFYLKPDGVISANDLNEDLPLEEAASAFADHTGVVYTEDDVRQAYEDGSNEPVAKWYYALLGAAFVLGLLLGAVGHQALS